MYKLMAVLALFIPAMLLLGCDFAPSENDDAQKTFETFRDCADCPEMVVIPAGSFMMGQHPEDPAPDIFSKMEVPRHQVTIGYSFAMSKTELSVREYLPCVADGACSRKMRVGYKQGLDDPLAGISWNQAAEYLAWLSEKTGETYRFPTEAEWEYAARGGEDFVYIGGNEPQLDKANCKDCPLSKSPPLSVRAEFKTDANDPLLVKNTSIIGRPVIPIDCCRLRRLPALHLKPNAFGLYGMGGNLEEFTSDCWHISYDGAPTDGSPWKDGSDCKTRMWKGGRYNRRVGVTRLSLRGQSALDLVVETVGIRVFRVVDEERRSLNDD